MSFDINEAPPPFEDLEAANQEIRYLQRQLYQERLVTAKARIKRVTDRRSQRSLRDDLRVEILNQVLMTLILRRRELPPQDDPRSVGSSGAGFDFAVKTVEEML